MYSYLTFIGLRSYIFASTLGGVVWRLNTLEALRQDSIVKSLLHAHGCAYDKNTNFVIDIQRYTIGSSVGLLPWIVPIFSSPLSSTIFHGITILPMEAFYASVSNVDSAKKLMVERYFITLIQQLNH